MGNGSAGAVGFRRLPKQADAAGTAQRPGEELSGSSWHWASAMRWTRPSGAAAANALGLSTQMPVQQTYLSRSRSQKRYVFGKQQVTIRTAAAWNFLLADRPAGQAIRALTWLGPAQASAVQPTLRTVLPPEEWEALLSVRAELPVWLAELLSEQDQGSLEVRG